MTPDEFERLERLIDRKLGALRTELDLVKSHERDIRAVKAVLGFLIALGGMLLVIAGAIQGWFAYVDHVMRR